MLTGWKLTVSKCFIIPQRYVLGLMGFFAMINVYAMRVCLSISITEMVNSTETSTNSSSHYCNVGNETNPDNNVVTNPDKLYDWDETTQGIILSSFYWGYLLTHLPGGIIANKFGGKYILGFGILSTGVFTVATPSIIYRTNGNWKLLVLLRVVEGLGEGVTYPALNALLAQWVPSNERSTIGTLVYAGGQMGTIICNLISGQLIAATQDWASVFYLFGSFGIIWCVFFQLVCYSNPKQHPFISDKERIYLEKELENVWTKSQSNVPWKALFTCIPFWALIAAEIGHDWGLYNMVTDLPKYMKNVLGFDVAQNGIWNSIPYAVMWIVSMSSGWICDRLISKQMIGVSRARKLFTCIGAIGPAIFIMAASYAGCNSTLAVWMFTIGMGTMGTFYCGMKVNALDLAPNYAGIIMAFTNGIGALAGIITPYMTGALTEHHTLTEWRAVFWVAFVIFSITSIIFVLFGSGDEQWWNDQSKLAGKHIILESTTSANNMIKKAT